MMRTMAPEQPLTMGQEDVERRKRVRRTTLIVTLVVLFFYFGFIALMLVRAHR
jgi:phosphate starvation-inducible membrane PsiE